MVSTNDFKTGITVEIDGAVWQIVDFQHVKPGKGAAFVRAKMRNLISGAVVERTFNAGEKLSRGHVEKRGMQYLYSSDGLFTFMDNENYEQIEINEAQLGDAIKFLKENMSIDILFFKEAVIGVDLPTSVTLEVTETDPGIKGDTATGGSKPATLETGHIVKVPLFIEVGDVLRIDTRSGEYVERA